MIERLKVKVRTLTLPCNRHLCEKVSESFSHGRKLFPGTDRTVVIDQIALKTFNANGKSDHKVNLVVIIILNSSNIRELLKKKTCIIQIR